jgi:hypothetical protein
MEAVYFHLFRDVGKGLSLLQADLKMVLCCFSLMCRGRGDTRDRLRETKVQPKRYGASVDQLTSEWVKLSSLSLAH